MSRILLVEDEAKIAEVVQSYLEASDFEVIRVENGPDALRVYSDKMVELIILDLMLPGMSGEEVCRRIRASSRVPIIMMTAKAAEIDRIRGLGIGADDYITKPFSPKELVARVKAVLRRSTGDVLADELHLAGGLVIDTIAQEVRQKGLVVSLTPSEYRILLTLARHPKRAFSRTELVERAMGFDFDGDDRSIDSHIKNLRKKIESDPKHPLYILSVYGVGYRLGDGGD